MRVAIAIVTIRRSGAQYLGRTVASMRQDPMAQAARMAVCNGSPVDVEDVADTTVLPTSQATWDGWKRDHGGYRLTRNMLRAHRWLAQQDADVLVFAEDDIVLADRWLQRSCDIVASVSQNHGRFVLSCCSSHPGWCFGDTVQAESVSYARFLDPALFWGNQLLVYPRSTIGPMTAHIQACVAKWKNSKPGIVDNRDTLLIGDQATKTFFTQTGASLFVSMPSLAKHVGAENTWSVPGAISVAFRDHPTARWED